MSKNEKPRFESDYQQHLKCLKLQGKADKTIEAYSRAIRRVSEYFDCPLENLTPDNLKDYFAALVDSHSWNTVIVIDWACSSTGDMCSKKTGDGLILLNLQKLKLSPIFLPPSEIERLLSATRKLRYRVFLLTTYSMGLRLEEALCLQLGDIDAQRKMVHIRRGKGHKDRMLPLPDFTLKALRALWLKHRHPVLLFPNPAGRGGIQLATSHMDRGGAQGAMKAVVKDCHIKNRTAIHGSLRHKVVMAVLPGHKSIHPQSAP